MKRIIIDTPDWTIQWAGGSFIPVWSIGRKGQHVPDLMIPIPRTYVKSQMRRDDIVRVVLDWIKKNNK